jgi:nitrogen regulatory protein PII
VEPIIEAVLRHARTGQPDDGKIFVLPLVVEPFDFTRVHD